MATELGEAREAWGQAVWKMAEDFANHMLYEDKPYYIVFAAKQDRAKPSHFRQSMRAYYHRPAAVLGILVWYVDNLLGKFELVPELSSPPDVLLDPNLLSKNESDSFASVSERAKGLNVLLS